MSKAHQGMRSVPSHPKPWEPEFKSATEASAEAEAATPAPAPVPPTATEPAKPDPAAPSAPSGWDSPDEPTPPPAPVSDPIQNAQVAIAVATAAFAKEAGMVPKDEIVFVSAREEDGRFDFILGPDVRIRGTYDGSGRRILFSVPKELVARAARHEFVRSGRLVMAG